MRSLALQLAALTLVFAGCGSAQSSSIETREVAAPRSGYVCFAVLEDGRAVGGNCVKE